MKNSLKCLILILTSACASPSFPNGMVYSMIKGDSTETSYLYGTMLDRSGERVRMTIPSALSNSMICVMPDYYSEIMEWAKDMRKESEKQ